VDLGEGAGNRRGRGTCEPTGKWVKPPCEETTGREKKEVKDIPLGREHWKALKRARIWDGQIKRE
jgi:hypothetical protein